MAVYPGWTGSPFDARNSGAYIVERDQFCQIGDAKDFEAVLVVDQTDIDLVERYLTENDDYPNVELKLDARRWGTMSGKIAKVASAPMEVTPVSLAGQGGGELDAKSDSSGMLRPLSTSYQARVPLQNTEGALRVGLTGQGKIYTGWQPLGRRLFATSRKRFISTGNQTLTWRRVDTIQARAEPIDTTHSGAN